MKKFYFGVFEVTNVSKVKEKAPEAPVEEVEGAEAEATEEPKEEETAAEGPETYEDVEFGSRLILRSDSEREVKEFFDELFTALTIGQRIGLYERLNVVKTEYFNTFLYAERNGNLIVTHTITTNLLDENNNICTKEDIMKEAEPQEEAPTEEAPAEDAE